jgi:anti-sigma factor RsiW
MYYARHVEREILSAMVDGECGADERRYVHDHLQECDGCRELAEEFGLVQGLLTGLPRLVAPESFVSDALEPHSSPRTVVRRTFRGRRRYVAAAAAAVAIGVTGAGLAAPPPSREPPVDVFLTRHVSVSSGNGVGGEVLFAVNGR